MKLIKRIFKKLFKNKSSYFYDIILILISILTFSYITYLIIKLDYIPKVPKPIPPKIYLIHPEGVVDIFSDTNLPNFITIGTNTYNLYEFLGYYNPEEIINEGDLVIIKHFNIEGVVVKKVDHPYLSDAYTVRYKDNNNTLHTIVLPKNQLMKSKSGVIRIYDFTP